MARKIGQAFGLVARSQILGRRTEYAPAACEMVRYDMVFAYVADTDVDVDFLVDQIYRPVQYLEVDLESGVHLDQFGQHGRHVVSSESGTRRNSQSSPYLNLGLLKRALELIVDIEYTLGPRQHQFTAFGHRDMPGGAMKQLHFQGVLEHGDTLAHVRRRRAQLESRGREVRAARRMDKHSEVLRQNIVHEVCSPKSRVVGYHGTEKGLVWLGDTR